MSIVSQVKRIVNTSSYAREETPRIADALGVPVDPDRVDGIARGLVDGTISNTGTAERLAMMAPQDELVRGEVNNSPARAQRFAAAALRTARELDGGHLPADDRTAFNRMMLDVRYQESADLELRIRSGSMREDGSSPTKELLGPSNAAQTRGSMRSADDHALAEASAGRIDALPQATRRKMAQDAVLLTTSGSFKDLWDRKPASETRLDVDVLLATARQARSASR